jgi:hypothetical protein
MITARVSLLTAILVACPLLSLAVQESKPAVGNQSSATATLRIKTDIIGAKILLDGQDVGTTPVTLPAVSVGKHRLPLIKEGYHEYTQEIEVIMGKPNHLFIVMQAFDTPLPQLPMQFKVIHKHVSGMCKGLLTVNADSLDYKADDNKDVFHIPLREVNNVSRSSGSAVIIPIPMGGGYALGVGNRDVAKDALGSDPLKGETHTGTETRYNLIPFRFDTSNRGYSFVAYEEEKNETGNLTIKNFDARTKELFDIVYRLWTTDLSMRKKVQ